MQNQINCARNLNKNFGPTFSLSGDAYQKACQHFLPIMLSNSTKVGMGHSYFTIFANFSAKERLADAKLRGGSGILNRVKQASQMRKKELDHQDSRTMFA